MVIDGNGQLIAVPEHVSAISLVELVNYRDSMAKKDLLSNMYGNSTPRYLLLAAIAFSLRRNIRLQNRAPTSDDLFPDKAFRDAIAVLPDAS
jgi:hypothetical protein